MNDVSSAEVKYHTWSVRGEIQFLFLFSFSSPSVQISKLPQIKQKPLTIVERVGHPLKLGEQATAILQLDVSLLLNGHIDVQFLLFLDIGSDGASQQEIGKFSQWVEIACLEDFPHSFLFLVGEVVQHCFWGRVWALWRTYLRLSLEFHNEEKAYCLEPWSHVSSFW